MCKINDELHHLGVRNLLSVFVTQTVLGIIGASNSVKHASGARDLEHNVTTAKQVYDYKKEEWPLTQPIPKLEAVNQCSGKKSQVTNFFESIPYAKNTNKILQAKLNI